MNSKILHKIRIYQSYLDFTIGDDDKKHFRELLKLRIDKFNSELGITFCDKDDTEVRSH